MGKVEIYRKQFLYYKQLADKSIQQCEDASLFKEMGEGTNSIAIIMKHLSGNMLSRWTNIFEEDGEKEWRNRDMEFVDDFKNKEELVAYWEKGWKILFETLNSLEDHDLSTIIYIRNMGCSVNDAIIRQLCHYPYHVGQIVFIAKQLNGRNFKSLSIPKGQSKTYNQARFEKEKTIKHFTEDTDN